jgi:hypothetical protein
MRILLIILSAIATQANANDRPIYWQYPGPFGERLETAFSKVQSDREQVQLITEAERRAHLKSAVKKPVGASCLEDDSVCRNHALAIFRNLGMGGRVLATAKRTDMGYAITLRFESLKHKTARSFSAEAQTLEQAAREVLNGLHGQGTLSLALTPDTAFFFLNDVPYGQGSGDHLITTGEYTLRIEAPGYKAESMPLSVQTGQRVRVNVLLVEAGARINLTTKPAGATAYLDGDKWSKYADLRMVTPGKHVLRVELENYNTFIQTLELKPSTVSELALSLVPSDPPWRQAIKSTVPDTTAMPAFFRGSFGLISIRDRSYDMATDLSVLKRMADPLGGQSFGFAVSLRRNQWLMDVLRVKYTIASGQSTAQMSNFGEVEVTDLSRLTIAPAWVGIQHPVWRIVPYAMGGLLFTSETINGKTGSSRFTGDQIEIKVGAEIGLRYVFSKVFFAGLHHTMEGLPGSGNNVSIGLHCGYAFELPAMVKERLP